MNKHNLKAGYTASGALIHMSRGGYTNTICTANRSSGQRRVIAQSLIARNFEGSGFSIFANKTEMRLELVAKGFEAELCKVCWAGLDEVAA